MNKNGEVWVYYLKLKYILYKVILKKVNEVRLNYNVGIMIWRF